MVTLGETLCLLINAKFKIQNYFSDGFQKIRILFQHVVRLTRYCVHS